MFTTSKNWGRRWWKVLSRSVRQRDKKTQRYKIACHGRDEEVVRYCQSISGRQRMWQRSLRTGKGHTVEDVICYAEKHDMSRKLKCIWRRKWPQLFIFIIYSFSYLDRTDFRDIRMELGIPVVGYFMRIWIRMTIEKDPKVQIQELFRKKKEQMQMLVDVGSEREADSRNLYLVMRCKVLSTSKRENTVKQPAHPSFYLFVLLVFDFLFWYKFWLTEELQKTCREYSSTHCLASLNVKVTSYITIVQRSKPWN